MSIHREITDEDFVPFLHGLGVETYKKSFEWMFSEAEFAGIFSWLYNSLDQNNALTARVEYRNAELEKKGYLQSPDDLESTLLSIQKAYPGICLPGDHETVEDVKLDISMLKERLAAAEKQHRIIKELIKQNELISEQLTIDVAKLHAIKHQLVEDEASEGKHCLALAAEVENLTDDVVNIITRALDVYANCHDDKNLSKKFIFFGPLEPYRHSQALFRSHFDLYTTRQFEKKQYNIITNDDHRGILVEARELEDRLSDAAMAYIESKAELCGELAKLALVTSINNNVHPSQFSMLSIEAMTAKELHTQEEAILEQQVQLAVRELVSNRTKLAVDSAVKLVLAGRHQMLADLTHLQETSEAALSLDRLLYCALRAELHSVTQCAQFAAQLRAYIDSETAPVATRIESMNEIISQQEELTKRIQSKDILLHSLCSILGMNSMKELDLLSKMYWDLENKVKDAKVNVKEGFRKKELALAEFKNALVPLRAYVYNGCTKKPNCVDRTVAALTHAVKQQLDTEENTVVQLGVQFTAVRNGDKENLRKLWQWFLTDPARLQAAVKGV